MHHYSIHIINTTLLVLSAAILFIIYINNSDHEDLGTPTLAVGGRAMNNRRNLSKSTKKKKGKNRKSKSGKQSKRSKRKNIFNVDDMCDIDNFISVSTYDGGGTCDKTFRAEIGCNGDNTQCTYEEESVSNYIYCIY